MSLRRHSLLITALAMYLAYGWFLFGSTGDDDSYITYSAAYFFSQTGAVININGDPVEQSSSLLSVLILGSLHKLTDAPLPLIGVVFSICFGGLAIFLLQQFATTHFKTNVFPAYLLALSPGFVYWACSGMETTLLAVIILSLVIVITRVISRGWTTPSFILFSVIALAHFLVRPESALVLLCALFFLYLVHIFSGQKKTAATGKIIIQMIAVSIAIFMAIGLWRYFVFQQFFPQPVYAKMGSFSVNTLLRGLFYLIITLKPSLVLEAALIFILLIFKNRFISATTNTPVIVSLCYLIAHICFVISSGGDYMAGGRFIAPIAPLVILLAYYTISEYKYRNMIIVLWLALICSDSYTFIKSASLGITYPDRQALIARLKTKVDFDENRFSWVEYTNQIHLQDISVVLRLEKIVGQLHAMQVQPVTIMSGQMGMTPYYLAKQYVGKVKFIDRHGLVTQHFTACPAVSGVQRSLFGVDLPYSGFFDLMPGLQQECGFVAPMLIYDLSNVWDVSFIVANGYTLVYQQEGYTAASGVITNMSQFIAVRDDLLPALGEFSKPYKQVF